MSSIREEKLEYILRYLANKVEWCVNPELLSRATVDRAKEDEAINEAKQAITSLIKEECTKDTQDDNN